MMAFDLKYNLEEFVHISFSLLVTMVMALDAWDYSCDDSPHRTQRRPGKPCAEMPDCSDHSVIVVCVALALYFLKRSVLQNFSVAVVQAFMPRCNPVERILVNDTHMDLKLRLFQPLTRKSWRRWACSTV